MTLFEIAAALLGAAAVFAYVNARWVRQAPATALMAMSLLASLVLIALDRLDVVRLREPVTAMLERVEFDKTLLHGMLGALLFAGALHVRLADLRAEMRAVSALAVVGTVLSTVVVACLTYPLLRVCGLPLGFGHCLLFGALISPTDPIAVLGILKSAGVPKAMETQIAGESLFNDGVGVVLFTTILGVVAHGGTATPASVMVHFAREAVGGVAFGLGAGYVTYRLLRTIDHYQTELLLTLALVVGGYAVAERLHISAPIAAVTAGLLIGNQGRALGMSDVTRDYLDKFWSLIDEILNSVLFVLIGFELLRLAVTGRGLLAGLVAIPVVLVARLVSVAAPLAALLRFVRFGKGTVWILTWGGLRGGISVALALSTPHGPAHDVILTMTYVVVVFSLLVQALTLGKLARRFRASPHADHAAGPPLAAPHDA